VTTDGQVIAAAAAAAAAGMADGSDDENLHRPSTSLTVLLTNQESNN